MRDQVELFYDQNQDFIVSPLTTFGPISSIGKRVIDKYLPEVEGKCVLDIGCGHGQVLLYCRGKGAKTIGIDLSMTALQRAVHNMGNCLIQADGESLPLESSSLDVVLSFEAVEHFGNQRIGFREISRVLKKDGLLIVSTPNYFNCAGLLKILFERVGLYAPQTWAPFSDWRPQVFEHLTTWQNMHFAVAHSGFHIDDAFTINLLHGLFPLISIRWSLYRFFPMRFARHAVEHLVTFAPFKRLGMNLFIIAHKETQ